MGVGGSSRPVAAGSLGPLCLDVPHPVHKNGRGRAACLSHRRSPSRNTSKAAQGTAPTPRVPLQFMDAEVELTIARAIIDRLEHTSPPARTADHLGAPFAFKEPTGNATQYIVFPSWPLGRCQVMHNSVPAFLEALTPTHLCLFLGTLWWLKQFGGGRRL